jgi:hypothetical protein
MSTGEQAMHRFTAVGGSDVIAAGSMATRTSWGDDIERAENHAETVSKLGVIRSSDEG